MATELTPAESKAITVLERLEKMWPNTLILFCGTGGVSVRRIDSDGWYGPDTEMAFFPLIKADGGDDGGTRKEDRL